MKGEDFLRILNDIDDKFIEKANADLADNYREDHIIRLERKKTRKPALIISVCSAAAVLLCACAAALSLRTAPPVSPNDQPDLSDSSGVSLIMEKNGIELDLNPDEISPNRAYALDEDGNIRSYEAGSRLNNNIFILKADAELETIGEKVILKKQTVTVCSAIAISANSEPLTFFDNETYLKMTEPFKLGKDMAVYMCFDRVSENDFSGRIEITKDNTDNAVRYFVIDMALVITADYDNSASEIEFCTDSISKWSMYFVNHTDPSDPIELRNITIQNGGNLP